MGKLSHKIWVKVICLLIIAIFLFNQTAYARHYTPNESMKDFFKSDADQAAIYVVGVALSVAIPGLELLGPVSNSALIISAAVNMGSQVAVACGADPKTTMIVGGVVGGLASAGTNVYNGLQSGAFAVKDAATGAITGTNYALIAETIVIPTLTWTASATASAYAGEKNPILGSFAGMATGAFTQGFLTSALDFASTTSGHPLTDQERNDFNQLLNSEGKLAQNINNIDSTDSSGATRIQGPATFGVDARGNGYFAGNDATLNMDGQVGILKFVGTMPKPTNLDQAQNPIYVIAVDGKTIPNVINVDGETIPNPTYYRIATTLDQAFNTQVTPARWESAQRVAGVVRNYGAPLTDVKGNFLYNIDNPIIAGLKNIQTLGPGFLTQTAVKAVLYEALGEKPFKMPLINFAGSITGALTNEAFGKFYAGTTYNPWARPPDLNFGQYMGRVILTEAIKAGISTGFNYLETNIKSDSFPGTTHLLVSAGEFVGGAFASSLVSLAYPETRALKVGGKIYALNLLAMQTSGQKYVMPDETAVALDPALAQRNDFGWVFRETLKDNFREVLINTFPRFAPSEHVGLGAAGAYMNYVQDTIGLNASATPFFINIALGSSSSSSGFSTSMKDQAINDLGLKTGQLLSNSFLPDREKMYFGVIKPATEPQARLAFYNIIEPEDNEMKRLKDRLPLDSQLANAGVQFMAIIENEIIKANPQAQDQTKDIAAKRAYAEELGKTGHSEGFVGPAEPYSVTISTYNLALVPTQTYEIRQLKAFDRPKIPQDTVENIYALNKAQNELFIKAMVEIKGIPDELNKRITGAIETQSYSDLERFTGDLVALPLDLASLTKAQELLKIAQNMLPEQRIMQNAFAAFEQEHSEAKDLLPQLRQLFTPEPDKGPYIKGISAYTDYLSLYSVTERNRIGQNISTQYYREDQMFKTVPIERQTQYFYGPFGPSYIKTLDKENYLTQHHLNLYKVGEVYGRPSPYAALQTTEFQKGAPQLAFLHLIPEITLRIAGILGSLRGLKSRVLGGINVPDRDFSYDAEKFASLESKLPAGKGLQTLNLAELQGVLSDMVKEEKIKPTQAKYFEQCLVYLADNVFVVDNKPIAEIRGALAKQTTPIKELLKPGIPLDKPISEINEVINPIESYNRIFYQAKDGKLELRSFDSLQETTLAYYLRSDAEKRQDRYELLPSYTIQTAFEGGRPSFTLSARYDYTSNILNNIKQKAEKWFEAYGKGKGLKVEKATLEGEELYFITKKGEEDFLYPFASGYYLYNTQELIPDYLRQILWDNGRGMLLDENNYWIHLGGFGDPLRYSDFNYRTMMNNKVPKVPQ